MVYDRISVLITTFRKKLKKKKFSRVKVRKKEDIANLKRDRTRQGINMGKCGKGPSKGEKGREAANNGIRIWIQ